MLDSILMAFSLYSRIPVPQAQWKEENMRWCICFLPLVGAVIGALQAAAFFVMTKLACGVLLRTSILTALPALLSGGIHLDGFLDTCDAIHSYKGREDRLAILKDPHAGAFAIICGIVYFVLLFGVWSEARPENILPLCCVFALSRSLSAWSALTFPKAKKDGMLRQETDPAARGAPAAMAVVSVLAGAAVIVASPARGTAAVLAAVLTLLYYRRMSDRVFGGVTGDLSGWFTQMCELVSAGAVVLCGLLFQLQ